jgi:hypothetical protein
MGLKGKYVLGYRDTIQAMSDVKNWVANSIHDPQKERLVFKQMCESVIDNNKVVIILSSIFQSVNEVDSILAPFRGKDMKLLFQSG